MSVTVSSIVWFGLILDYFFFASEKKWRGLILRSVAVLLWSPEAGVIMPSAFLKGWGWNANNALRYHMQQAIKPYSSEVEAAYILTGFHLEELWMQL